MYSQETEEVFVLLLEVSSVGEPIRVALDSIDIDSKLTVDSVDTYSTAVTFAGGFFGIELPEESGENISTVRLSIDNVDRAIVAAIRSANAPPECKMWVVLRSSPDVVEAGPYYLTLESAQYDAMTVTGELTFEDVTNRRYPAHEYTPINTPGLF
jgi:acyl carrier protein